MIQSCEWDGVIEDKVTVIRPTQSPPQFTETAQANIGTLKSAGQVKKAKRFFPDNGQGAILTIQAIADEYHDALHPKSTLNDAERDSRKLRFEALNAVVQETLGTSVDVSGYHEATLFGRSMKSSDLSEGQRRLLAFAAGLFEATDVGSPSILILDEPELHLHPEAAIKVLQKIADVAANTQVWIGTHSLPLLASLDPASIWCMKDGEVFYAGNKTEEVLHSLMGGATNIDKLTTFLSAPAEFAANTFVAECLSAPSVSMTGEDDPQANQIASVIRKFSGKSLRVLDWGAGRGDLQRRCVS